METLLEQDERQLEADVLERLASGADGAGRATVGPAETIEALNERRVETLVLDPTFDGHAQRCPTCGLLFVDAGRACPSDGSRLEPVEHLREAAVEAALAQDANLMVIRRLPDRAPFSGIGALLRF